MNQVNFNSNISFQSIKPTIRVGEDVVRSIRNDLPGLKSCTMIVMKMEQHENNIKYDHIRLKLYNLIRKKLSGIKYFRNYGYIPDGRLKERAMRLGNAECEVHSDLVNDELIKRGKNPKKLQFEIIDNELADKLEKRPFHRRSCNDHSFVVLDIKENADLNDLETWGNNAVIVDSLVGIAESAFDAIQRYKMIFRFEPEKEQMFFTKVIN